MVNLATDGLKKLLFHLLKCNLSKEKEEWKRERERCKFHVDYNGISI